MTVDEEADFLTALKPVPGVRSAAVEYQAHIHVRYSSPDAGGRMRPRRWCGDHEENSLTSDMLEDLRAIYLPPFCVRSAPQPIKPDCAPDIPTVRSNCETGDGRALKKFDSELKLKKPVEQTQTAIQKRHESMLGSDLKQALSVGLTNPDFQRLAARLSLTADSLDIEQNGLGYNNLIYMAVVLSELSLNPDAAYKALIVEELEQFSGRLGGQFEQDRFGTCQ